MPAQPQPPPHAGPRPKVLVILHQEHSSPGRVGQILTRRGFTLDIRKPRYGDLLPHTLDEHAGAVVFGGPMSANDNDAFIRQETDWLAVPLAEEKPLLGICLGAQMMACQLGGTVVPHGDGRAEIGYYDIAPTPEGRALLAWPEKVYQWHVEGFSVPAGATLLARGEAFENQAFSYGPKAYGIQFHPELTLAMLYRWTTHGSPRMAMPGAQNRRDHFAGRAVWDAPVRQWLEGFLELWLPSPPAATAGE